MKEDKSREEGSKIGFILNIISGTVILLMFLIIFVQSFVKGINLSGDIIDPIITRLLSPEVLWPLFVMVLGIGLVISGLWIKQNRKKGIITSLIINALLIFISILFMVSIFFIYLGLILLLLSIVGLIGNLFSSLKMKNKVLITITIIIALMLVLILITVYFVSYKSTQYKKENTIDGHTCTDLEPSEECSDVHCPDEPYWHLRCMDTPNKGRICRCFYSKPFM